jgi:hypothetical protein
LAQVARVLDEPGRSSPELIARIVRTARQIDESGEAQPDYDHSVLIAAALVMRDGDAAQREEHGAWAAAQFQAAMSRSEDPVHRYREGLQFNPIGIATLGMVAAVRHDDGLSDARFWNLPREATQLRRTVSARLWRRSSPSMCDCPSHCFGVRS